MDMNNKFEALNLMGILPAGYIWDVCSLVMLFSFLQEAPPLHWVTPGTTDNEHSGTVLWGMHFVFVLRPLQASGDVGLYSPTEVSAPESPPLEESFTIYLGEHRVCLWMSIGSVHISV